MAGRHSELGGRNLRSGHEPEHINFSAATAAEVFGFGSTGEAEGKNAAALKRSSNLDPSMTRGDMDASELAAEGNGDVVVIRKYPLRCYRLDENHVAQATMQRIGKYAGQVAESDGRQVPHGKGTFKTSTGYVWMGVWEDGVPHDTLGNEILDGLPTPEDPLLGGDIRGHWENGKCVSYDKTRSLEKRLAEGDYEQSMSMQDVGLFGQSAMLPGHPSNPPLNPVIYGTIIAAAVGLLYWISQVEIDWTTKEAIFTGPAFFLALMVFFFAKSNYEGQQHRIWGCMNNMMLAWLCSASGHFWIAGMIFSGEFTGFNTGVLTLPFGFMQLGATITLLIHSVGASYGIPASWQMVRYEKKKARALANGESFKESHHWWSDGSAIGSPFIVLLDSPMATWERVILYVWYFLFGFGQLAMFIYLETRGPTEDARAHAEDLETAFRFRWVLLVSGIGGVIQFLVALLHLDAEVQKKWALTQNLVGVTAFCIESVPLLANTFITLHIFLNPYYTFEDMEGLAMAQVSTAMFCIVVMLVQLYIEAREARKRADGLVEEDMSNYNKCWDEVISQPQAGSTLMRIRKLCADAKQEATRNHAYTTEPKQRLSGLDPSLNKSYGMLLKLLQLAGALNEVVQNLGRRWSEESGATSNDGFKQAPVKTAKRAIEKVWRSYNGDPASLTDIVRTSIVCASLEQLERVSRTVFGDKAVQVVRIKNRFDPNYDSSTTAGYRDISMNFRLTSNDGQFTEQIFEVQIQLQAFYNLKSDKGHAKYAQFRDLRGA